MRVKLKKIVYKLFQTERLQHGLIRATFPLVLVNHDEFTLTPVCVINVRVFLRFPQFIEYFPRFYRQSMIRKVIDNQHYVVYEKI